jgi:hypothetical protein
MNYPAAMSGIELQLKDGSTYPVTAVEIEKLSEAYPGQDVETQLRRMMLWLDANPSRRKTRRGIKRFMVNWLSRQGRSSMPAASGRQSTRDTTIEQDLADTSWAQ